jgi:hypothetical protein
MPSDRGAPPPEKPPRASAQNPKPSADRLSGDGSEVIFPWQPGYKQWCADLAVEKGARRAAADARLAAKRAARVARELPADPPRFDVNRIHNREYVTEMRRLHGLPPLDEAQMQRLIDATSPRAKGP